MICAISCSLYMPTQDVILLQGFSTLGKSQEDISDLGEKLMVALFGDKSYDTLSSLRHVIFTKKVANAPERLPPTSHATGFPSQRVCFPIMVRMGMENEINPTEWGWKQKNVQLISIMTQNNAAL